MGELNSIHMSVKRDSTNGIATDAPYYDTKKRNIDSKIENIDRIDMNCKRE